MKIRKFNTKTSNETLINFNYNSSTAQKTIAGNWAVTLLNNRSFYSGRTRKTTSKKDDNTVIVNNDKGKQPFTSTGLLTASSGSGTVFLLGNGYGLTAAHCVFFRDRYRSNLQATFTYEGALKTIKKTTNITEVYIPNDWVISNPGYTAETTADQRNNDWALVKFDDVDLQKTFGATTIASNVEINNLTEYVAVGYPTRKQKQLCYSVGQNYAIITPKIYELLCYTSEGMSGGPILAFYSEYDERLDDILYYSYTIGIVSTGQPDEINSTELWTGAYRITNEMIDFINEVSK